MCHLWTLEFNTRLSSGVWSILAVDWILWLGLNSRYWSGRVCWRVWNTEPEKLPHTLTAARAFLFRLLQTITLMTLWPEFHRAHCVWTLDGSISKSKWWEASSRLLIIIEPVTIFILLIIQTMTPRHSLAIWASNMNHMLLLGTVIKHADQDAEVYIIWLLSTLVEFPVHSYTVWQHTLFIPEMCKEVKMWEVNLLIKFWIHSQKTHSLVRKGFVNARSFQKSCRSTEGHCLGHWQWDPDTHSVDNQNETGVWWHRFSDQARSHCLMGCWVSVSVWGWW